MSKAIRIYKNGGPEVMSWEEYDPGRPQAGEALIAHKAVGLNFIDVYHRTGLYPLPALPAGLGMEGAGVVEEVGPGVTDLTVGDRVAYATPPTGAYAEKRILPADRLVKLPQAIAFETGAAMMLQGMTAAYLLTSTFEVKPGHTILIQAAAGGVGTIACQWAKHIGATVIGTVGTEAKAELAKAHGCDYPILYEKEDFVAKVKEITNGAGVDVVYDSVGQATFAKSLDCLKPRGMLVSFGQSSGSVGQFDPQVLSAKGSLYLTRPTLISYAAKREDLLTFAQRLFQVVESGAVKIEIRQTYPLDQAARAHQDLEARKTTGSTILLPG